MKSKYVRITNRNIILFTLKKKYSLFWSIPADGSILAVTYTRTYILMQYKLVKYRIDFCTCLETFFVLMKNNFLDIWSIKGFMLINKTRLVFFLLLFFLLHFYCTVILLHCLLVLFNIFFTLFMILLMIILNLLYVFISSSLSLLHIMIFFVYYIFVNFFQSGESCLHAGCRYGHASVLQYLATIHTNIDLQDNVSCCCCLQLRSHLLVFFI